MVLNLTYEAFASLISNDPVPHVVVDCRSSKDTTIPFVQENNTKVVSKEDFKDELVAEDGCAVVVYDDSQPPALDSNRAVVHFDISTKPAADKFQLTSKDCQTVMTERGGLVFLDVRRKDEIDNFGMLDFALHIPLHELLDQLATAKKTGALTKITEATVPVVVGCRTSRRAKFCAQLLHDVGVKEPVYLDKGACGMSRYPENKMQCYKSYELGEPIPQPSDEP